VSEQGAGGPVTGILQSLRNLATTLVALLQNRIELLATDLEEERIRLLQLLFWAAGALFFFALGVLMITMFVVLLLWDSHRLAGIVVLAAVFLAIGVGLAIGVRNRMHMRSRLFSASLEELAKDKERLTSR
jgi:uncharacterized membrane protein YqjE